VTGSVRGSMFDFVHDRRPYRLYFMPRANRVEFYNILISLLNM